MKDIATAKEFACTQKAFWLVWNATTTAGSTCKHETEKSAVAEAYRLSQKQAGQRFVVLKATGYFQAGPPVPSWTKLK